MHRTRTQQSLYGVDVLHIPPGLALPSATICFIFVIRLVPTHAHIRLAGDLSQHHPRNQANVSDPHPDLSSGFQHQSSSVFPCGLIHCMWKFAPQLRRSLMCAGPFNTSCRADPGVFTPIHTRLRD
ncbi:hypothetical protein C8R44DRAFT_894815 [Mycena epipterygia]|nr:hypothetical protein C8R44DRAFT_894815 [Mycena epipterygia]